MLEMSGELSLTCKRFRWVKKGYPLIVSLCSIIYPLLMICLTIAVGIQRVQGRLPLTRKTWKFWLENEMVHTIPFETDQKL